MAFQRCLAACAIVNNNPLRRFFSTKQSAIDAIGGSLPVSIEELAERASLSVLRPMRNPVRDVMTSGDGSGSEVPPMLGVFNDIPWHQLRESDIASWAKAGFAWIVNDGEHNGPDGRMTRELNATFVRYGITPVQRLHREALSEHGDVRVCLASSSSPPPPRIKSHREQLFPHTSHRPWQWDREPRCDRTVSIRTRRDAT